MSRKKRKHICPRHGAFSGNYCFNCDNSDFCPSHPECALREDGPLEGTCAKCETLLTEQINNMFPGK